MPEMIRLFATLAIPYDIAEHLAGRQSGPQDARWRPAETLHITLRFFGDIPENRAEDLASELSRVAGPPLTLTLHGVGAFGEGADIDAIWAGVEANPALDILAGRCEAAARRAGLKPDTRVYKPHVTLAYLRRPEPAQVAAWIQANSLLRSPAFTVSAFGLYSSRQTSAGSRYELEQVYPLR
jgi:RNA 2',3'-cyclic 3'-phosphodiesterase